MKLPGIVKDKAAMENRKEKFKSKMLGNAEKHGYKGRE